MKIGDLVRFFDSKDDLGIIVEVRENILKSKNMYITYLVYWLKTGFKSSHGEGQLEILNSKIQREKDYLL